MINENKGVLAPSVFKRFSCKGAACRYNCCRDWSITMSRDEYRGWKKCGILPKGKLENEKVHLCPEKLRSERIYAEILLPAVFHVYSDTKNSPLINMGAA